jgi:hypothetical protein
MNSRSIVLVVVLVIAAAVAWSHGTALLHQLIAMHGGGR